jgi:hypothetical protein
MGIVISQRDLLKVKSDGVVGKKTLEALNCAIFNDSKGTFDKIFQLRVKYLNDIVNNSIISYERKLGRKATENEKLLNTQKRFLKGWLNRLNDFKYSDNKL